ncbi:hypothetical protein EVAR_24163_1 [Eumeta japonica]|uniref:Uncharacterized protein n=1 Tax=Eumeta variegata TaxID=151549 RepID=A0A4C1W4Z7_EUMVA|nr:hypothetical protein EVAR_24163_1 [Eumeta japonica]
MRENARIVGCREMAGRRRRTRTPPANKLLRAVLTYSPRRALLLSNKTVVDIRPPPPETTPTKRGCDSERIVHRRTALARPRPADLSTWNQTATGVIPQENHMPTSRQKITNQDVDMRRRLSCHSANQIRDKRARLASEARAPPPPAARAGPRYDFQSDFSL